MNKETLNKLRQIHARGANPSRGQFGELIALAERTTSPVSELTNEQIIAIADRTKTAESRDGDYILPISFARAILAAAAPHAQAPAAPVAEQDERAAFEAWANANAIRSDLGAWEAWQARAAIAKNGGVANCQDNEGEKV